MQTHDVEQCQMQRHSSVFPILLLGALPAAPLTRFARGHEEPICSSHLDREARERKSSIRIFESPDHAALCTDWPTSRESPGRIDTHQYYIPQFYADYLERYSVALIIRSSGLLITLSISVILCPPRSTSLGAQLSRQLTHAVCR